MPLPLIPIALQLASLVGPSIVEMIAGEKAGDVAKEVANIATRVTGKSDPEDALHVLNSDPSVLLEFRRAVMENETKLQGMYLADRQDARSRDVELKKAGFNNSRADFMIGTAFLALITVLAIVWNLSESIPPALLGFFNMVTGFLLKMLGDAFQFEFGSSRGSKDKDKQLHGG